MPRRAVGLLLGAVLLLLPAVPRAQEKVKGEKEKEKVKAKKPKGEAPKDEAAPAGTWKVYLPTLRGAGGDPVWLLKFDKDGERWSGELVSTRARWPKAKLEKVKVAADRIEFNLKTADLPALICSFALPKDGKAKKLRGIYVLGRKPQPIELERTQLGSLEAADLLKERLATQEDGAEAAMLAFALLGEAEENKATAAEVRAWAAKAVRSAGLYGPGWEREVLLTVSELLAAQKGFESIALGYAKKAEGMLSAKESVGEQRQTLAALADVFEKVGKEEEAKKLRARAEKLDIRVKAKPFAGRKGKSKRVVLVELFTNAQMARSVAADLAFDALGRGYKTSEVVLLQYHVNFNRPEVRSDPLANPLGEARVEFYEKAFQGLPTVMFNGKPGPVSAGGIDDAPEKYDEAVQALAPLLEAAEKAELKLSAVQKGNKITIDAEVAKLAETGDDVRLRVALVEREVSYKGLSGLTRFRHVVRDMPGGDAGTPLKAKTAKKSFTVDVEALRKKLKDQLEKRAELVPFPDKSRPLELKNFRVIAFVQNDKSGEVLQAVQAEVTVGKEEKPEKKEKERKKEKETEKKAKEDE